jgi:NADP-dependent 3-hydroxy acid dehydrogenase YdfG
MTSSDVYREPNQQLIYIYQTSKALHTLQATHIESTPASMSPKVFFVTGTSTGFGAEYVKKIISEGDHAVATARNSSKLEKPEGATDENYLAVDLDVTKKESIDAAFKKATDKFGRLDIVVNK